VVWHSKTVEQVLKEQYSSLAGLTDTNIADRQKRYGLNELRAKEKKSAVKIFLEQFNSFIIWILISATVVSFVIGEKIDAIVIFIILILNAIFGFIQQYKAEKSIEALKKLAALKAKVIRNGKEEKIEAALLVPGDIILLETGDKVPADARLIEATRLEIDESSLTGESTPVKKDAQPVPENAPLAERLCILHSSTIVSSGRAKAIVVETGMCTEIGKIADMVQQAKDKETPLQHKLAQLAEFLGIGTLIICAIVFLVGIFRADLPIMQNPEALLDSFMVAVSLAVAAIPEGLPAVVTICLALGVQRMVKKNALIRVLPAVETLGSTNVICTDKTGTLTYNQMTVREIYVNNQLIDVTGQGYEPEGFFELSGKRIDTKNVCQLLEIGALCNDAKLMQKQGKWNIFGDPTEAALVVAAEKAGLKQDALQSQMPRVDELPFDSARKLMTTIHKKDGKRVAYVKGAPEMLIEKCDRIAIDGKVRKLSDSDKKDILDRDNRMATKALRVLAFAYKEYSGEKDIESKLIFVGLMGMIDPPRVEVRDSIVRCKVAGIKVVMITGDHKATAMAIGKELGLEGQALTGLELEKADNLSGIIDNVSIYARVSPEHKMRIVNALKTRGYIVAMTGDGVNDAPALKRADIGIAMGITGTDVAKEASDMILTDDNFRSIVNAVEEGRGIYDNIKKFVKYLLSSNLGEILTIFIAMMIGYHDPTTFAVILPLVPIQLLWINLLTDGLPALALGIEPTDPAVMQQPPRKKDERILSWRSALDMSLLGIVMAAGTLYVFHQSLPKGALYAQTMAFTTIVMFQLFNVLNCKSETRSLFGSGFFKNKWLIYAILSSLALQMIVIYTPLSQFMNTVAISFFDWVLVCFIGISIIVFEEIRKMVVHGRA
jgi:Ca2+-transporting ATPase